MKNNARTKAAKPVKPVKPVKAKGPKPAAPTDPGKPPAEETWQLRLYVAGQTPRSMSALSNLRKLCETNLAGRYTIEVIDLLKNPQLAAGDQIFAIPTLVRRLPEPMKRIIGDLSNLERSMVGLDLRKSSAAPPKARDAD